MSTIKTEANKTTYKGSLSNILKCIFMNYSKFG